MATAKECADTITTDALTATLINRRQQKSLRAATGTAGHAVRFESTSGNVSRKSIARTLLQVCSVSVCGWLCFNQMFRVAVADHVIRKHNRAHARERGAAVLLIRA